MKLKNNTPTDPKTLQPNFLFGGRLQYKRLHHEESWDNWIIRYAIYIPKGFLLGMLSGGFCSIVLLAIRLLEARPKYRRNNKVRKTWRLESVVIPSLIGTHSLLSRIAIFIYFQIVTLTRFTLGWTQVLTSKNKKSQNGNIIGLIKSWYRS